MLLLGPSSLESIVASSAVVLIALVSGCWREVLELWWHQLIPRDGSFGIESALESGTVQVPGSGNRQPLEGPATHLCLVSLVCRSYETKPDFAGNPWKKREHYHLRCTTARTHCVRRLVYKLSTSTSNCIVTRSTVLMFVIQKPVNT